MARRKKQMEFEGMGKPGDCFGGSLLKGNPKTKRPISSKLPIHIVLRTGLGGMRHPKIFVQVEDTRRAIARKYGVKVYEAANVGNHIHLLVKIARVHLWAPFIRELAGRLALIMKRFLKRAESYWLYRPYTRVVAGWRKPYRTAKEYVHLNWLEAEGFISRKETRTLKDLRAIFDGG